MKIFICDFLFSAAGRLLGWMSTEVVSWVVQARTVAKSLCRAAFSSSSVQFGPRVEREDC